MPAEPAQEPQNGPPEPEPGTTTAQGTAGPQNGPQSREDDELTATRREAAERRRQLRETEAERDALRARVDRQDRAEVERIAATRLQDPADLFLALEGGLDDLRDDDGELDRDAIEQAIAKVIDAHPHWAAPQVTFDQGVRGRQAARPSFGQVVKDAAGR